MIAYPDKLSFHHDTTTQQFNLQRIANHSVVPLWACSEDGDKFRGATYTAEEIAKHFRLGHWREVSFAEAPKIVFPITVKHIDDDDLMVIDKYLHGHGTGPDWAPWDYSDCERFIREGMWIVQGPQKAPEGVTSPSKPLVVSVQSEQLALATERANALASALVAVRVCLEDFQMAVKNFDINVEVV